MTGHRSPRPAPPPEAGVDPGGDGRDYLELQVNPLNTVCDLMMSKPYRERGKSNVTFDLDGLRSAVKVRGVVNDDADGDDEGWTVEGRIPWSAFKAAGGKPEPGARWRFSLSRYDFSTAFERPELSCTSPLRVSDFHRYEDYGELTFVGPGR